MQVTPGPRTRRPGPFTPALGASLVFPALLAGAIAQAAGWSVTNTDGLLAGAAILSGFLFTVLVFVFQLRLQVHRDPRVQQREDAPQLVDDLFEFTTVAALYAIGLVVLLALSGGESVTGWPASWLAAMCASFVSLLVQVCLRTRRAYRVAAEGTEFA